MITVGGGWPGEATDSCLPTGYNSREVSIHVRRSEPSGVPTVPVEMAEDKCEGY